METLAFLSSAAVGGVVVKLIDVASKAWAQRARARGRKETATDVLHRARYVWRDHAWHARGVARHHGGEGDLDDPPTDPYVAYIEKETHS